MTQLFPHGAKAAESDSLERVLDFLLPVRREQPAQVQLLSCLKRLGQMRVEGAGRQTAFLGNLVDGFSVLKSLQRIARGIAKTRPAHWRRGKGILGKHLAWIRPQMRRNFRQKAGAELAQFLFPDAADPPQLEFVLRICPGHVPQ